MTDLDYLKLKLEDKEKAFDKLHKLHIELLKKQGELEKENRILKITYAKCKDCKHADLYNPQFAYPHIDPKCRMNIKSIHSDSDACENFELIGRKSR